MIGKSYWKGLCLPAILYAAEVVEYTDTEIKKLQIIENTVFRTILGARKFTPVSTLRGEVGASLMISRVDKNKLNFICSIMNLEDDDIVKKVVKWSLHTNIGKWSRNTHKILEKYGLNIENMNRRIVKEKIKIKDTLEWKNDMENKVTLHIYNKFKDFGEENKLYDNDFKSELLFKLRSNTLELNQRKKYDDDDIMCPICKKEPEDIYHFLLFCENLAFIRNKNITLQYPQMREKDKILKQFLLFDNPSANEIENTKRTIACLWNERRKYVQN